MKEKLTISEMARLRRLTTETLRHYDRIDLFKPAHTDPSTGYRYYSIFQFEILGTIKELRQLGMNTDEVKLFFRDRHVSKSLAMLKSKHEELQTKLKEWVELERNVREKIAFLEEVTRAEQQHQPQQVVLREFPERALLTLERPVRNNLELCYGILDLENNLSERAPILASNRLGVLIRREHLALRQFDQPSTLFVSYKDAAKPPEGSVYLAPGGSYACLRCIGEFWERTEGLETLCDYIEQNGYQIAGDALQVVQIDITITDQPSEAMFEIQIPIGQPLD
ncbi:transcriptional regulator, MerR family [Paenibacillus curdlanolyticus YK9]|uniref:Transcriptional regulator, MerR family n=1 Tax=Paenibacillus curdlanolyticus YK9 TaxID=717606 RepID=E0IEN2_9BACL|nr:MerR family transcriptional regulator [Paenibacillus curdlanolyticus]EFM09120.1 transcriptional regulator, MerR family [Paenibacillus curdlanolyticus YK9]